MKIMKKLLLTAIVFAQTFSYAVQCHGTTGDGSGGTPIWIIGCTDQTNVIEIALSGKQTMQPGIELSCIDPKTNTRLPEVPHNTVANMTIQEYLITIQNYIPDQTYVTIVEIKYILDGATHSAYYYYLGNRAKIPFGEATFDEDEGSLTYSADLTSMIDYRAEAINGTKTVTFVETLNPKFTLVNNGNVIELDTEENPPAREGNTWTYAWTSLGPCKGATLQISYPSATNQAVLGNPEIKLPISDESDHLLPEHAKGWLPLPLPPEPPADVLIYSCVVPHKSRTGNVTAVAIPVKDTSVVRFVWRVFDQSGQQIEERGTEFSQNFAAVLKDPWAQYRKQPKTTDQITAEVKQADKRGTTVVIIKDK
ncbi:MAG: hypothetical protein LBJ95_03330 [Oscillospiraceae bacterium]|nr:hypothetical protein [Oscillospiraceae bacterium]